MDAKITKNRLSRLLSYDWIKIIAVAVALIFAWWIVFRATKTDIRPSQNFTVVSYYCNDPLGDNFDSLLSKAKGKDNVFSYEVMQAKPEDLTSYDERDVTDFFETRLALSEPDVLLVPALLYPEETSYPRTYLDNFFNRFFDYVYNLDPEAETGYLAEMATYLDSFYDGGYKTGELNADKVEQNFRARIKEYNDKRFKKESEIKAGLQEELARIEKYRNALVAFYGYLDEGIVSLSTIQVRNGKGEVLWEGKSALNLCPDETKTGNLSKYVSYSIDQDGKKVKTAKDMHAMIFRYDDVEPGYQYEALLYINYLIENARSA